MRGWQPFGLSARERLARCIGRTGIRGSAAVARYICPPTRELPGGERLLKRADGTKMWVSARSHIEWHEWFVGMYEPEVRKAFHHVVRPGDFVVDVGANVGAHSLSLGKMVGPSGRVIAVECHPLLVERLARNIMESGLRNVEVLAQACGPARGTAILFSTRPGAYNQGQSSFVMHRHLEAAQPVKVDVHSLDAMVGSLDISSSRFSLLKIDVEGGELGVLAGGQRLLSYHRPAVVLEYDPAFASRAGWSWNNVLDHVAILEPYRVLVLDSAAGAIDMGREEPRQGPATILFAPESGVK